MDLRILEIASHTDNNKVLTNPTHNFKNKNPQITFGTISTVIQENVSKLEKENKGKADYIIVVDKDMTTTY